MPLEEHTGATRGSGRGYRAMMNNVINIQQWAKRRALHRQAIDAELTEADFFWLFDWKPTEWEGNEYIADILQFPSAMVLASWFSLTPKGKAYFEDMTLGDNDNE